MGKELGKAGGWEGWVRVSRLQSKACRGVPLRRPGSPSESWVSLVVSRLHSFTGKGVPWGEACGKLGLGEDGRWI